MTQPHVRSLRLKSCHSATKENTTSVVQIFEEPPRGMYRYLCHSLARDSTRGKGDVPDNPEVVRPMPGAPESHRRVVVGHASDHVLGRIHPVQQRPKSEEPPWDQ
jgi:hypothetical protein